ncbi:MAG TPA: MFS transporter [Acidimicrobiales bacterium]|nr:MFS transporter [Acidimicrobiales bacterium]
MTQTTVAVTGGENASRHGPITKALWYRELDRYPDTGRRVFYLGIVVLATIILYYQLYVAGAVAPQILAHYHMTFRFYVYITVVGNAIGAFTSILAGLADRWGRANMVAYGLGLTALLVLFGIPNAPGEWAFATLVCAVGFVEGIVLVATPALVRDFSPQLGRASAMGFWTLGPVVGSLVVAEVASHTLSHLTAWQDQFIICGIAGLVVFAIALVGLRELSPGLRDQLMVSIRDRTLIEARAKGIDISATLRRPWRQMLHMDIIASAFAISVFLIIYYTAVGFNVIYFETIFGFSASQANAVGNWLWAFDAGALIVVGIVSDRVRVRKPFMIVGGLGAVAMTILYLEQATNPHTGYYTVAWMFSLLAIFLATAYGPWMASFTETVERRNPALTATGLAVWGWILRAVVALSIFVLPFVVSSVTPLVESGALAVRAEAIIKSDPNVSTVLAHPKLFAQLAKYPPTKIPGPLLATAIKEVGIPKLTAAAKDAKLKGEIAFLQRHAAALASVKHAAKVSPGQWQTWYWVCVAGEALFLPFIFLMAGRWRPKRAREDARRHEEMVNAELEKLAVTRAAAGSAH